MKDNLGLVVMAAVAAVAILYAAGAFAYLGLGATIVDGYYCTTCEMQTSNACTWQDGTFGFRAGEKKCIEPRRTTDDGIDYELPGSFNTCIMSLLLSDGTTAALSGPFDDDNGVCWFGPYAQEYDGARRAGFTVSLIYVPPTEVEEEPYTPPAETEDTDDTADVDYDIPGLELEETEIASLALIIVVIVAIFMFILIGRKK